VRHCYNVYYINQQQPFQHLNSMININSIIIFLEIGREFGGAIGYLSACYKRLISSPQFSTADEKLKSDIIK
jgi:hypothetical protein